MVERDLKRIDIGEVTDWAALAEEVHRTNEPRVLQRAHEDVAMLVPLTRRKVRRAPRGKLLTKDNPLWNIVGIGQSEGPTNIALYKHDLYKHEYVADAYDPRKG